MDKELIVYQDPKSPISEVYRALRTNLQFKNAANGLKSLLITSTLQEEGKSITTANLALAFASAGKSTVIVDADMRKARQHEIFNIKPTPGLSNYLCGIDENGYDASSNLMDYIVKTEVKNLSLLPAGNIPPNPSELLGLELVEKMVEKLNKHFDLVIFDGTPSLVVTDSIVLSRVVDSTLIVVSYKQTKMDNLQKVKRDIENVGGKIAGIVLNKVEFSPSKYKEKYYYYGSYVGNNVEGMPVIKRPRVEIRKERKKEETIDGQQLIGENEKKEEVAEEETENNKVVFKIEKVESPKNHSLALTLPGRKIKGKKTVLKEKKLKEKTSKGA